MDRGKAYFVFDVSMIVIILAGFVIFNGQINKIFLENQRIRREIVYTRSDVSQISNRMERLEDERLRRLK